MAVALALAARRPSALLRPLAVGAPPAFARGKFMGEADGSGKVVATGSVSLPGGQKLGDGRKNSAASVAGPADMHHRALQSIADQLSAPLAGLGGLAGGPLEQFRQRRVRLRQVNDQKQQEDIFSASTAFLMEPKTWTYGNFAAYQRKVLELAGGTGWRRRLSADDPSIQHLEKELKVLEAMTPIELMSNHKSVFTSESKKLIAEKAGVTVRYVNQVIMEHDILRADRRWYQIREQFKKPLPRTFEDRQDMAEYDRPFSEAEREYQESMLDRERKRSENKRPPRFHNVFYRIPTCGGNQWSTRPPRWYPVQWKMRPERKDRLAGVGVAGGGGDRGRPWGKLASFAGAHKRIAS